MKKRCSGAKMGDLRGLSLIQPYASLVAFGDKRIETRGARFTKKYRGPLLIHASKGMPQAFRALMSEEPFRSVLGQHGFYVPRGAILAVVDVTDAWTFDDDDELGRFGERARHAAPHEHAFGLYTAGRVGLVLENVRRLPNPIPWSGRQCLWYAPDELRRRVEAQLP